MANVNPPTDEEQLRRLMPHLGSKVVCVVAQKPFTSNQSTFCSLEPLVFSDGVFPRQSDFPKNGRIWWMVDQEKLSFARPGQLVRAHLEQSNKAGAQGEDVEWYQAERGTITSDDIGFIEVLLLADDKIAHPYELLEQHLQFDHPPHRNVLIEWRRDLYGLWNAESTVNGDLYDVRLQPAQQQAGRSFVHCIDGSDRELQKELQEFRFAPEVTFSDRPKNRSAEDTIELEISLAPTNVIYRRLTSAEKVPLTNDFEFLGDLLARESLLSEDNQVLRDSVTSALARLSSTGSWRRQEVQSAVSRIEGGLKVDEGLRRRLADTLLSQGFLTAEINHAVADAAAVRTEEIEQETLELKQQLQSEIDELRERREAIQSEVDEVLKQAEEQAQQTVDEATEKTVAQLSELNIEIARLTTERDQLSSIVEPGLERLQSAREALLQDYILLSPLLEQANARVPNTLRQQEIAESRGYQPGVLHRVGSPITDPVEFVERRFHPILHGYRQHANAELAKYFCASVMACRLMLCNELSWALAFAEATGGTAVISSVEPDWLTFDQVWKGEFKDAWQAAVSDPDRLVFLVLDGVNRSPTAAWVLPLLHCAAGNSECLPSPATEPWPANLRMLNTLDANDATFKTDARLLSAVAAVPNKQLDAGQLGEKLAEGYVDPATWRDWTSDTNTEELGLDTMLDEHQVEGVFRPMVLKDCQRLAAVLIRLGVDRERAAPLAIRFRVQEPAERFSSLSDE